MITVTFVRHGESEDNLKDIWAGWKDAPLSESGRRQAAAAAKYFSATHINYIYSSPSLRARATGEAILLAQLHEPPFTINPNLREQNFGIAEGQKWALEQPDDKSLQELYDAGIFPVLDGRDERFPEGESANDLAHRAWQAVRQSVLPHLHEEGVHVVITSHGLCIYEMLRCVLKRDPASVRYSAIKGLVNTGWTRAQISVKDKTHSGPVDPENPPLLDVVLTDINRRYHLENIGEWESVDEEQSLKREFFSGNRL